MNTKYRRLNNIAGISNHNATVCLPGACTPIYMLKIQVMVKNEREYEQVRLKSFDNLTCTYAARTWWAHYRWWEG